MRSNLDKEKAEEDAVNYQEQYKTLTAQLDKTRQEKTELLHNAGLPLPGLSVEDGELTYQGQKWDNMSGSDQLRVATAIVRRLNPQCGFVLLDKLEQMDLDTLNEFGEWLEQEGLQAIATRVSTGGECSIIIEDGYVKVKNARGRQTQIMEGRHILMNIIRGKIPSAQKVVIYGPEGIGKTSFAACFPDPLFIDTEGGTKHIDVARLPAPTSWTMLLEQVQEVKKENTSVCKTLVLDTADWAEQLCIKHICDKYKKSGIEDFGYGKGYIYLKEEFGRLLNLLEDVIERGVNVAVTAHAKMRKFEQPDEMGAYDRWEMKLDKNVAPLIKEWADMVLFANYKVYTVKDEQTQRSKAQGGKRVLYASHHPCWDAKNRHGLPDEMPLDYTSIAPFLNNPGTSGARTQERETALQSYRKSQLPQKTIYHLTISLTALRRIFRKESPGICMILCGLRK